MTTYVNLNKCRSWNQTISTALTPLTSQICGEVTVINRTGTTVTIFDKGYLDAGNGFILENNESFTFRGVTNSNQVSAQTDAGSGTLYYRTQYFSNTPAR